MGKYLARLISRQLLDVFDCSGSFTLARIDPERPFVGMERHCGRQEDRHPVFFILFLNRFQTILRAYRSGAMTYACWVAVKPARG